MKAAQWSFFAFLCLAALALPATGLAKIAVIVQKGSPLSGISQKDVRLAYLGEKQFFNGTKLAPLMIADDTASAVFFQKLLRLTKEAYKKIWLLKVFKEGIAAPETVSSSLQMLSQVESQNNAIGFIPAADLPADGKLKVLFQLE